MRRRRLMALGIVLVVMGFGAGLVAILGLDAADKVASVSGLCVAVLALAGCAGSLTAARRTHGVHRIR